MSKTKCPNYNCLFRIPNDETHQGIIKEVRKMMRDYGTMWQLTVKGRKPKPGTGPYPYGSVPLEDAQELGIYLYEKRSVSEKKWKNRLEWQREREDSLLNNKQNELDILETKMAVLMGKLLRLQSARDEITDFVNEYINKE